MFQTVCAAVHSCRAIFASTLTGAETVRLAQRLACSTNARELTSSIHAAGSKTFQVEPPILIHGCSGIRRTGVFTAALCLHRQVFISSEY